ncbi:MAG: organic solvent tolerance protein [Epsilonproteobacteria bacterium (ex Lamellibrachia satsuma)]|nr:MAG: organic solvent tolerance protein [Epsilonproteobacteria bacterium (ex Lamellibrachia satsuma)]
MLRIIFLFCCIFIWQKTLFAAQENSKIEVMAKHLYSTKITVHATDGIVVYYQDSVIKAESASYDKETKVLVLDGKVEMIGYKGTKEQTDHMEIHTDNKEVNFKKLFLVSQNDIWLFSDNAHRNEGNYTLGRTVLSSCDINDPLWKMVFSRSNYDSDAKYMKVYNAKVYFKDIPIFYSPYLAFSTNNERSSGLLFPLFGYTQEEGFVYEQPIYWAVSPSMDIEFNPQIRTDRSIGLYSTFRFVDSNHSSGKLRIGYFKDKASYAELNSLPESSHYGLEFNYESSEVLSGKLSQNFTDGLYINTTFLNDIDYLNLQKTQLQHFGLNSLQESRLNYFLYNEDYYAGINAKYFIDTRKEHNDDTLQILPSVQLHKYLDHFLWNNLTYSVDLQLENFDRKKGVTLKQVEMKVPLEFTASFFDDFLNVSLGEELYYSKFFFGNGSYVYDDFQYYSNIYKVKLFTDLTKNYDSFVHVLQPSLEYVKPGNESEKPVQFDQLEDKQKELFTVGLPEENYAFSLSQYFYDTKMKLVFYQRLSQKYYMNRTYKFADISNEMQYNWKQWQFYNNLVYAPKFGKIRESSVHISLHEKMYDFTVGHSYKQVLSDQPDIIPANDISFDFGYMLNDRVKFDGSFTYNIDDASSKQWRIGGSYNRDCWSMAVSLREDIIPRPTGFTKDNGFYVQFNFIPFGGLSTGGKQ